MMQFSTRRRRHSGLGLRELLLGAPLLVLLIAAVGVVYGSGSRIIDSVNRREDLGQRANRSVDRLALLLSGATPRNLGVVPEAPHWIDSLSIERLDSVNTDGRLDWRTTWISFEYASGELDDGKDNNGDGLIDEGRVVMTTSQGTAEERRTVLYGSVREFLEGETPNGKDDNGNGNGLVDERGLCFVLDGELLRIFLTLERPGAPLRDTRTASSVLGLRD